MDYWEHLLDNNSNAEFYVEYSKDMNNFSLYGKTGLYYNRFTSKRNNDLKLDLMFLPYVNTIQIEKIQISYKNIVEIMVDKKDFGLCELNEVFQIIKITDTDQIKEKLLYLEKKLNVLHKIKDIEEDFKCL